MPIKLPTKTHCSIPELLKRWECPETELRHLIVTGTLKPSYVINHLGYVGTFVEEKEPMIDEKWRFEQIELPHEDGDDEEHPKVKRDFTEGFYYLLFPEQTAALDCNFVFFSRDPNYKKGSLETCLMLCTGKVWPRPISLDDVIAKGAVMMEEIDRFENATGQAQSAPDKAAQLGTRERDSLLKLVVGMAIGGYSWDPGAAKSSVPGEIASDVAKLGMSLSEQTIRKFLVEAATAVLPSKRRPD